MSLERRIFWGGMSLEHSIFKAQLDPAEAGGASSRDEKASMKPRRLSDGAALKASEAEDRGQEISQHHLAADAQSRHIFSLHDII